MKKCEAQGSKKYVPEKNVPEKKNEQKNGQASPHLTSHASVFLMSM